MDLDPYVLDLIWTNIKDELARSAHLHPTYPTDPLRRTALMCEEAGEALKAALDLTRPPNQRDTNRIVALYDETVHTASMAIMVLHAIHKEEE